eukprot:jgi/Ulvmu1/8901/UM049_0083.1
MRLAEESRPPRPLRQLRRLLARPGLVLRRRCRLKRAAAQDSKAGARHRHAAPLLANSASALRLPELRLVLSELNRSIERASKSVAAKFGALDNHAASNKLQLGFPVSMQPEIAEAGSIQSLVSAGSKELVSKWDGRGLLRFKIYDFALYANSSHVASNSSALSLSARPALQGAATPAAAQVETTPSPATGQDSNRSRRFMLVLRRQPGGCNRRRRTAQAARQDTLTDRVRAATAQVEMSLCVRPARDLPLAMLRAEYSRILRKRMHAVGGAADDPALRTLLSYFHVTALAPSATRRGCVRRGAVVVFSRSTSGHLAAAADGVPIATVRSPKLCEAVFDLYLGEAPVCSRAKAEARAALESMLVAQHVAATAPRPVAVVSSRVMRQPV